MITQLKEGTQVHVAGRPAGVSSFNTHHAAYVSLSIGTILQGEFCLHITPDDAIRLADMLILAARAANQPALQEAA